MGKIRASRFDRPEWPHRVHLRPRDRIWFEKLHRHGDLPWPILHEYTKEDHGSIEVVRERLRRLTRKGYMIAPKQQAEGMGYLGTVTFRSITKKGSKEIDAPPRPLFTGPWKHDAGVACSCASIELEVTRAGHEYLFHDEIVKTIGKDFFWVNGAKLRPDRMFGVRKADGSVTLCMLEFDRSTEQITGKDQRKTIHRNINRYTDFIQSGQATEEFKIRKADRKIMVLTVTTNPIRMITMSQMTTHNAFAFHHVPYFGRELGSIRHMPHLATD